MWEVAVAKPWVLRCLLCLLCPRCCERGVQKFLEWLWLHCSLRVPRRVGSGCPEQQLLPLQGLRCQLWVQPGWVRAGLLM